MKFSTRFLNFFEFSLDLLEANKCLPKKMALFSHLTLIAVLHQDFPIYFGVKLDVSFYRNSTNTRAYVWTNKLFQLNVFSIMAFSLGGVCFVFLGFLYCQMVFTLFIYPTATTCLILAFWKIYICTFVKGKTKTNFSKITGNQCPSTFLKW